jgi:hypothetical protein
MYTYSNICLYVYVLVQVDGRIESIEDTDSDDSEDDGNKLGYFIDRGGEDSEGKNINCEESDVGIDGDITLRESSISTSSSFSTSNIDYIAQDKINSDDDRSHAYNKSSSTYSRLVSKKCSDHNSSLGNFSNDISNMSTTSSVKVSSSNNNRSNDIDTGSSSSSSSQQHSQQYDDDDDDLPLPLPLSLHHINKINASDDKRSAPLNVLSSDNINDEDCIDINYRNNTTNNVNKNTAEDSIQRKLQQNSMKSADKKRRMSSNDNANNANNKERNDFNYINHRSEELTQLLIQQKSFMKRIKSINNTTVSTSNDNDNIDRNNNNHSKYCYVTNTYDTNYSSNNSNNSSSNSSSSKNSSNSNSSNSFSSGNGLKESSHDNNDINNCNSKVQKISMAPEVIDLTDDIGPIESPNDNFSSSNKPNYTRNLTYLSDESLNLVRSKSEYRNVRIEPGNFGDRYINDKNLDSRIDTNYSADNERTLRKKSLQQGIQGPLNQKRSRREEIQGREEQDEVPQYWSTSTDTPYTDDGGLPPSESILSGQEHTYRSLHSSLNSSLDMHRQSKDYDR